MTRRDREVLRLVVLLADAVAGHGDALEVLGAGRMEDILVDEQFGFCALEAAARQNASVRRAVRSVSWPEDSDPALEARFRKYD